MGDFAYTTVPGKIKPLLDKLRQVGVPPKANTQWLKTIGFTSSNDTSLLGVLKTIGLMDGSNVPTGIWSSYRGARHKNVLAMQSAKGMLNFSPYTPTHGKGQTQTLNMFLVPVPQRDSR